MSLNLRDVFPLIPVLVAVVIISVTSPSLAQGNLQANAQNGDPEAQFILGEKYVKGDGVPKDFGQGMKWLK